MKHLFGTLILIVTLCAGFIPLDIHAQEGATNYTLLAPLPLDGAGGAVTPTTTAAPYIRGMFILAIAIAGVLAVVMIIFGGIKYMSTDAFGGKSEAKDMIQNAIVGLLLAIGAWLILYTVNPGLVSINLSIERQGIPTTSGAGGGGGGGGGRLPGYTLTPEQLAEDAAIRQSLPANITVNHPPCANGGTSNCTNLVGVPRSAIDGVIALGGTSGCNCAVVISGGSEGGHREHGPGEPVVDIRRGESNRLDSYILGGESGGDRECGAPSAPRYSRNGGTFVNEGDHWHACY